MSRLLKLTLRSSRLLFLPLFVIPSMSTSAQDVLSFRKKGKAKAYIIPAKTRISIETADGFVHHGILNEVGDSTMVIGTYEIMADQVVQVTKERWVFREISEKFLLVGGLLFISDMVVYSVRNGEYQFDSGIGIASGALIITGAFARTAMQRRIRLDKKYKMELINREN